MNTEQARRQMVDQQVRTWDVFDPEVLDVIADVARDRYVPAALKDCAYADVEVPLRHGQCMLRPSIIGKLLQAVDVRPGEDVLEIGTGTGYLSHCLAKFAGSVTSIDIFEDFIDSARRRLEDEEIDNVTLECMDATVGLPPGKFDVIVVTGAVSAIDERFINALKPGGRLFIVAGKSPIMTAKLITREHDGGISSSDLFETDIPALVVAGERPAFSF